MKEIELPNQDGTMKLRKSQKLVGLKHNVDSSVDGVDAEVISELGGFSVVTLKQKGDIDSALDEVRSEEAVEVGTHVYFAEDDNRPVVPTGTIYCQLVDGVSREESQVLIDTFSLELKEWRAAEGMLVMKVTAKSPNPLKVAKALNELAMVAEALPDLDVPLDQYFTLPRDGLLPELWHLSNPGAIPNAPSSVLKRGADAKVSDAWRALGNLGSAQIKVAVIDQGFDLRHPDLSGKVVSPLNALNGTTNLPQFRYTHGTPCASVAVASANGSGLVGAAPNARFVPIHGITFAKEATERMFSHCVRTGVDVISASWGYNGANWKPDFIHRRAINNALTQGRNGKGCVICFAAGNEGMNVVNHYGTLPGVIAVGSSTSTDIHPSYSNRGQGLSVVAPSDGGWPILAARASWDPGNPKAPSNKKYYVDGRDRGPFYKHFGGTSSATPLVAGICALILSANPDLTSAQVKSILESTTDKIGGAGEYDRNGYSQRFGYGRVNADRAVRTAFQMRNGGGAAQPTQPTQPSRPTQPTQPTSPTQPTRPTQPTQPTRPTQPVSGSSGLYRFSVKNQARQGWAIQMGNYKNLEQVLKATSVYEARYNRPVIVNIDQIGGETSFRILVGGFNNVNETNAFRTELKRAGLTGPFPRNLADL